MPAGYSVRVYKKKYRKAIERIAGKIPAAFSGKKDRKRWISEVTNMWMQDMREKRND